MSQKDKKRINAVMRQRVAMKKALARMPKSTLKQSMQEDAQRTGLRPRHEFGLIGLAALLGIGGRR